MAGRGRLETGLQVGMFLVFLALPALDAAFELDPTPRPANQTTIEPPGPPTGLGDIKAWRDDFQSHLDDSFGWRSWAVRHFHRLNYRLFGLSEQDRVVVGKCVGGERWLYFGGPATRYHRAEEPLTNGQLTRRGRRVEERRRWLAERGIDYYFVMAPNKHSIYPEHLPAKYRRSGPRSRYEQLADYLAAETDVEMIDLQRPLLAAKRREAVYERTGTHWNARGAYVAYREIHQALAGALPEVGPPVAWEQLEFVERGPGELVGMLGLEGLVDERRMVVAGGVRHTRLGFKQRSRVTTHQDDPSLPRAVVFHDSFAIALAPYLAEHFSEAVFQWRSNFDGELVRRLMPDVVIEQRVERNLVLPPLHNILPPWDEPPR